MALNNELPLPWFHEHRDRRERIPACSDSGASRWPRQDPRALPATNPRVFGSVARGDATSESDIDLLVDLMPGGGNELLRVAGIAEELSGLLGTRVDVVAASLLRGEVSASAVADSVAV
jgi:uncharacterized protein